MTAAWPDKPLWVTARRPRDGAYLLSDGESHFITYKSGSPQGSTPVTGPLPEVAVIGSGWKRFKVQVPYRGPMRGLTESELDAHLNAGT